MLPFLFGRSFILQRQAVCTATMATSLFSSAQQLPAVFISSNCSYIDIYIWTILFFPWSKKKVRSLHRHNASHKDTIKIFLWLIRQITCFMCLLEWSPFIAWILCKRQNLVRMPWRPLMSLWKCCDHWLSETLDNVSEGNIPHKTYLSNLVDRLQYPQGLKQPTKRLRWLQRCCCITVMSFSRRTFRWLRAIQPYLFLFYFILYKKSPKYHYQRHSDMGNYPMKDIEHTGTQFVW